MAEVKWVKLTTDMFDNRKIRYLRRLPEGNNIVLIWVMLLTMAGRCNSGGMIFLTENVPYTPKMLADELDFEENTVLLALDALERLDMILTDNGVFAIAGWEEYQNIDGMEKIREQNRDRKRLQRERQRQALLGDVSQDSHVTVTVCHALEEEIEKDKEKEKEYHSFIQSDAKTAKMEYMNGTLGEGVVLMSEEQFDDLVEKLSLDELHKYFSVIVECEKNGRHYKKKSHYQAILDMAAKDRKVHK
jgi:predicted phage replisome organizer